MSTVDDITSGSVRQKPVTTTLEQMAQDFEEWENDYRANPTQYMTADDVASAKVSQLSADRAAYFLELLTVTQGGAA